MHWKIKLAQEFLTNWWCNCFNALEKHDIDLIIEIELKKKLFASEWDIN
jgi:hypothetical protein